MSHPQVDEQHHLHGPEEQRLRNRRSRAKAGEDNDTAAMSGEDRQRLLDDDGDAADSAETGNAPSSANDHAHSHQQPQQYSLVSRVVTALFYGTSSILIMIVNKNVLTGSKFPSFEVLGIGQMVATVLVLAVARLLKLTKFPPLSRDIVRRIWPLPLFFLGNMIFGLGGTKELSLPMLTVLRRFSILMTMAGEFLVLHQRAGLSVQLSVYLMLIGAVVAAANDLAFNLKGYIYVLMNDLCTAALGVLNKKKMESKDLGTNGLLYYNCLFMLVPAVIVAVQTGDMKRSMAFAGWSDPVFVFQFGLSCVFGFILNYSNMLCVQYNSALTTTIVGCLKNILITYMGMIVGGDYVFSWYNFLGLNISVVGSLIYTKVTFVEKKPKAAGLPSKTVS